MIEAMSPKQIRSTLRHLAGEARKGATIAESPAEAKRFEILAKKLDQTADLAVLKNLADGAPSGVIHQSFTGGYRE